MDSNPKEKRAQNRRYRRHVRQAVKPWRYRYWRHTDERYCGFCECNEEGKCWYARQPEEPAFDLPHRFSDKYNIIDWRYYVDEPEYRRK